MQWYVLLCYLLKEFQANDKECKSTRNESKKKNKQNKYMLIALHIYCSIPLNGKLSLAELFFFFSKCFPS